MAKKSRTRTRKMKSSKQNKRSMASKTSRRGHRRSKTGKKTRGGSPASSRIMDMMKNQEGGGGCMACGLRGGSGSAWRHNFYAKNWDGSTPPGASCNQTNLVAQNDTILGCRGGGKKRSSKKGSKRRIRSPFRRKKKEPKGFLETYLPSIF